MLVREALAWGEAVGRDVAHDEGDGRLYAQLDDGPVHPSPRPKVRLGHNEVLQPGEQEEGREDSHSGGGEEADEDRVRHAEGGEALQAGWLTARAPRVLAPRSAI